MKRIVSFLPSATELIYKLGAQNDLFGVTHECLYPEDAKSKPRVIDTVIDSEKLDSKQIDEITCNLMNQGKDIFVLNQQNIKKANPDLIVSQNTCEVCAAHTNQVHQAVLMLDSKPEIYSMDPHNIKEILVGIPEFAKIIGKQSEGEILKSELESRIEKIKQNQFDTRPKILAIEWVNPFFTAGHWVPEMVSNAGGDNLISKEGEHSRKMTMQEVAVSDPDIIVFMPCGFDVNRTKTEYEKFLRKESNWNKIRAVKQNKVYTVDANSFFSKPSIRTVTGIEILAKIIHPEIFSNIQIPDNSFTNLIYPSN